MRRRPEDRLRRVRVHRARRQGADRRQRGGRDARRLGRRARQLGIDGGGHARGRRAVRRHRSGGRRPDARPPVAAPHRPVAADRRACEGLAPELIHRALARGLVVAPAQELRPVADALVAGVVEGDLDDQLRAHHRAVHLARGVPAARLGAEALAGLVRREESRQLALLLGGEARAVPDLAQVAIGVVERQRERAERALLLAGPPTAHDRVDRAHALDLHHPDALARPVGRVLALGHHAFGALQPRLRLGRILRGGREVDGLLDQLLEPVAALALGQLQQQLVADRQHVEGDEARRRLLGQHVNARLGGVDALAERVEVLAALVVEPHDLAVEDVAPLGELQLGEVAGQRLAVARLQVDAVAVDERDRAEAVPLRLVDPAVALREGLLRLGELGEEGRAQRQGHAPDPRLRPRGGLGRRARPDGHDPAPLDPQGHAAARRRSRQRRGALQRVARRRAARLPADRLRPARFDRAPRAVRGLPGRPDEPALGQARGRDLPRLRAHRRGLLGRRPARRALRALRPHGGRAPRGAAGGRGARRLPAGGTPRRAQPARGEDAMGGRRRARALVRRRARHHGDRGMRLLVIGGTVFLGRHVAETALARGHEVTVFHRGLHGAAPPGAETLIGDRTADLSALEGGEWDAVIDTCGFQPEDVARTAGALADRAGHYGFVSSGSAYVDWPAAPISEDSPVWESDSRDYGPGKAACERAVEAAMPGRVLAARAGVIVGPYENIGRLPWWLRRLAEGGEVAAPGPPEAELRLIDARDLAAWMLDMAEHG